MVAWLYILMTRNTQKVFIPRINTVTTMPARRRSSRKQQKPRNRSRSTGRRRSRSRSNTRKVDFVPKREGGLAIWQRMHGKTDKAPRERVDRTPQYRPRSASAPRPRSTSKRLGDTRVGCPGPTPIIQERHVKRASSRRASQGVMTRREYGGVRTAQVGAIAGAEMVAAALMLPLEKIPMRWRDVYSSAPTAVAHPFSIHSANFAVHQGIGVQDPMWPAAGETFQALSRSAAFACIRMVGNKYASNWNYTAFFPGSGPTLDEPGTSNTFSQAFGTNVAAMEINLPVCHLVCGSTYCPGANPMYFSGVHESRMGFWIDGHASIPPTLSLDPHKPGTLPGSAEIGFVVYGLERGMWKEVYSVKLSGSSKGTYAVLEPGYYAVDVILQYNPGALFNTEIGVRILGSGPNMVHYPLPDYNTKAASINSIRVNAVSGMVSCAAPSLMANGRVGSYQTPSGESWLPYMRLGSINEVTSNAESMNGPFVTGAYSYMKPRSSTDSAMQTLAYSTHAACAIPLLPPGGWLVQRVEVLPDDATASPLTYSAAECYFTAAYGVEFSTGDTWYDQEPPTLTVGECEAAMQLICDAPQHFENPLHFSDITKFLKSAGRTALHYGPTILSLLESVAPLLLA